MIMLVVSQCFK